MIKTIDIDEVIFSNHAIQNLFRRFPKRLALPKKIISIYESSTIDELIIEFPGDTCGIGFLLKRANNYRIFIITVMPKTYDTIQKGRWTKNKLLTDSNYIISRQYNKHELETEFHHLNFLTKNGYGYK